MKILLHVKNKKKKDRILRRQSKIQVLPQCRVVYVHSLVLVY